MDVYGKLITLQNRHPTDSLKSDPWFRPLRKWCKDDKVWTKDEDMSSRLDFQF